METKCKICGRVKWGEWVPLPGGKFRHAECAIGSLNYAEWYAVQTQADQAALGHFFNLSNPEKGETDNADSQEK